MKIIYASLLIHTKQDGPSTPRASVHAEHEGGLHEYASKTFQCFGQSNFYELDVSIGALINFVVICLVDNANFAGRYKQSLFNIQRIKCTVSSLGAMQCLRLAMAKSLTKQVEST